MHIILVMLINTTEDFKDLSGKDKNINTHAFLMV